MLSLFGSLIYTINLIEFISSVLISFRFICGFELVYQCPFDLSSCQLYMHHFWLCPCLIPISSLVSYLYTYVWLKSLCSSPCYLCLGHIYIYIIAGYAPASFLFILWFSSAYTHMWFKPDCSHLCNLCSVYHMYVCHFNYGPASFEVLFCLLMHV